MNRTERLCRSASLRILICAIAAVLFVVTVDAETKHYVYVSINSLRKLNIYEKEPQTGELTLIESSSLAGQPGPLVKRPGADVLYASNGGQVTALKIDPATGLLTKLGTIPAGADPVYMSFDKSGEHLLVASWSGQSLKSFHLDESGLLPAGGKVTQSITTGPGTHSVRVDPANKYLYVPLMLNDDILQFDFNQTTGMSTPLVVDPVVMKPNGTGPRHFEFHPRKNIVYFINERASSVSAYTIDSNTGKLTEFQEISSVPAGYSGQKWSADIHITPNAKFLYASNRAHDSIAAYNIDETSGELSLIEIESTVRTPRDFALDTTGQFLYCAGKGDGMLAAYKINQETGELDRTQDYRTGGDPAWVLSLEFDLNSGANPVIDLGSIEFRDNKISFQWESEPDANYQILFKDSLTKSDWSLLDQEITTTENTSRASVPANARPNGFFQIQRVVE